MACSIEESDIIISDKPLAVVVDGSFNDVRVGQWKGLQVLCKRHNNNSSNTTTATSTSKSVKFLTDEIDILTRLQHPNIVIFIGCCYDYRGYPSLIITEYIPLTLHSIIEDYKIELKLDEILDISIDIMNALQYIHSFNPSIIHGTITSYNINIYGSHAKLANIEQSLKVFNATLTPSSSSSSSAAAAAAADSNIYIAPEMIAGRYTEKVDIYAYGIVLIHMCCSEYPHLDKRDIHTKIAAEKYVPLSDIIESSISYQASDRYDATTIYNELNKIKDNDRYTILSLLLLLSILILIL